VTGRVAIGLLAAALLAGCGVAGRVTQHRKSGLDQSLLTQNAVVLHGHPQAVEPVAGQTGEVSEAADGSADGSISTGSTGALPQPITNAQVDAELAASGISANANQATLISGGLALAPVNAPAAVQDVISAGNEIARLPYIWGGGHETYEDTGYDCSGSISFILAAAGLLDQTETSGQLESYGDPGPGKWITIFATGGHTFAYIAGLRFDTVALAETGSRWSDRSADEPDLSSFVVRHPPGL
jgi:cell wall-associated NlpC family hydrolase